MHAQRFFGRKSQRTGVELLRDPLLNKGNSFTAKERKDLSLIGLLPVLEDAASDTENSYQELLALERLRKLSNDLDKYDYLMRLYDTDKIHFFRLIGRNVPELLPLVYTPTVGLACENYALVHGNGRGLFIPITEAGNIVSILENWPTKDIRAVVVTDGEEVLGLGDLGAYAMGSVVGKLALCPALAGIQPETCLPIVLDVGTNNTKLLEDPLYFGLRQKRATGDNYNQFVNEFMQACSKVFGKDVFIQFEGFAHENALLFQQRYSVLYSTFNDDSRSTASALLSGLFTAGRKTGRQLKDEIFVCFGDDDSMLDFTRLLVETLKSRCSLNEREARSHIFMVDSQGLIVKNRSKGEMSADKAAFARPGQCLFAHGGPLPLHETPNTSTTQPKVSQANSSYIFPGLVLGISALRIQPITDGDFITAAEAVSEVVTEADVNEGCLYPRWEKIRCVSYKVASKIGLSAFKQGRCHLKGLKEEDIDKFIKELASYPDLITLHLIAHV
ncbi:unnamed protein product [Dibothriocephalus latus]|uniref:Malic enzyme n=1 Tax=Dibothriocephalus latus TaxID=60516 RepID=A0A3P6UJE9_DIBLA|nr:unnamed protein product [Dibothriocephalus latus]